MNITFVPQHCLVFLCPNSMTWSPQQKTHHTLIRKPVPSGLIEHKIRCFPRKDFSHLRHPKLILGLSFFYFAFSCGLEAFFQSQSFTFALCGPHLFFPSEAATLTTIYFSR